MHGRLVFWGLLVCAAAFILVMGLARGIGALWDFVAEPSLEAKSGRRYTPPGAVKRLLEKISEAEPPQ